MKVRVCPHCGKQNPENSFNCSDCGNTLSLKTLMEIEEGTKSSHTIEQKMPEIYCGNCGNTVQSEDLFCRNCFSSLDSKNVTAKPVQSAQPKDGRSSQSTSVDTGYKYTILIPIMVTSLISAPVFDFMPGLIIALSFGFGGGDCNSVLVSPVLALSFSLFTSILGWLVVLAVGKLETLDKFALEGLSVLVGPVCGFIAGTLAAIIYAPMPC